MARRSAVSAQKTTKRRSTSVASWNIDGLLSNCHNKHEDSSFLSEVKKCKIFDILETHAIKGFKSPLNNYKIYYSFRPQDRTSKRNSGGISIMVSSCISNGISVLSLINSNFSRINLHSHYLNLAKDLYVCVLHIHQDKSTYSMKHGDQFEHLAESLVSISN